MLFKGLKFSKKKNNEKGKPPGDNIAVTHMAEMEEELKDRTDGLAQAEKKLKALSDKVNVLGETEVIPEHHLKPIEELSIEPVDSLIGVDTDEQGDIDAKIEEEPEDANPVEAALESKSSLKTEKTAKSSMDADSLKALFTSEEEEENPLSSLINSLPDISIDELMDDLKEIKDIIRDWQKK